MRQNVVDQSDEAEKQEDGGYVWLVGFHAGGERAGVH
jgi:hypothetical protein